MANEPFAVLAEHLAACITATVPGTVSYRATLAICLTESLAGAGARVPELEPAAVAFAKSLDRD